MAAPGVQGDLADLEKTPDSSTRAQGYSGVLSNIFDMFESNELSANLVAYVQSILSDAVGVISSRPLLTEFITRYRDITDNQVKVDAGNEIVQLLAPKIVSFESQDTELKFILADAYETDEDFTNSAKTLQTIVLDSSQRNVSDDEKAKVWMRVCRCYLEDDDPTNALSYLNKIKQVIYNVTDHETRLQFQLSQARISDSQRNFLDASASYHQLSTEAVIDEEERLQALSASITCAVLAPAGPQRAKQLGKLYKDERAAEVPEFSILEKIFLDRLLSPAEVAAFAGGLKEHQLAKTSDGSTVLDKAILEHNLVAVSRIYQNITTAGLGRLLEVSAERAEAYAATMIESDRLSGSIDQIESLIHFFPSDPEEQKTGMGAAALAASRYKTDVFSQRYWDANVQGLGEEVERVTTLLQKEMPEWYAVISQQLDDERVKKEVDAVGSSVAVGA